MSKNQGFASVALIIIALLVLGGGYWVWKDKAEAPAPVDTNIEPPTPLSTPPDTNNFDTSNWKTYRNDDYRFEFWYPPEWREEGSLSYVLYLYNYSFASVVDNHYFAPGQNKIQLSIRNNPERKSLTEIGEQISPDLEYFSKELFPVTVADRDALKVATDAAGDVGRAYGETYYVPLSENNSVLLTVSIFGDRTGFKILESVLSTFRFVE